MENLIVRPATRGDVSDIRALIYKLAEYENLTENFVATDELLEHWLFDEKAANVLIAEYSGKAVGYALYFTSFSTFLAVPGIFLEDLFVLKEYRGKGIGKSMLKTVAEIAVSKGYGRVEWNCLDWNKSSIDFYLSLGAEQLNEWTEYRLTGEKLAEFARK